MTVDSGVRDARERALGRYLAVWQREADPRTLDGIVTADYSGHMGSRSRRLAELKADIAAFRASATDVWFIVEHRFGQGDYLATRLSARARGVGARI